MIDSEYVPRTPQQEIKRNFQVASPLYPSSYANNELRSYQLLVKDPPISLLFSDFDLQESQGPYCKHDFLEVGTRECYIGKMDPSTQQLIDRLEYWCLVDFHDF